MSQVYVWDKVVRIAHWSLATLFIVSYATGGEYQPLHSLSGYSIVVLLILRIVWGLLGPHYARFSQFIHHPKTVLCYLKTIIRGKPKRYVGHNPAGGAMIIAMLLVLAMSTLSGMQLLAIEKAEGPFANYYSPLHQLEQHEPNADGATTSNEDSTIVDSSRKQLAHTWKEIHEVCVNLMLLLVLIHIAGVLLASKQHKESLIKAMFTGYKRQD